MTTPQLPKLKGAAEKGRAKRVTKPIKPEGIAIQEDRRRRRLARLAVIMLAICVFPGAVGSFAHFNRPGMVYL